MARYKDYSYDQGIMVPIDFLKQIVPGNLEHTINWAVDNKIDLSKLAEKYTNDRAGMPK